MIKIHEIHQITSTTIGIAGTFNNAQFSVAIDTVNNIKHWEVAPDELEPEQWSELNTRVTKEAKSYQLAN